MSAVYTRCDSPEALAGVIARWKAAGQRLRWAMNHEEGAHEARLRDEHGRVTEVAVLVVEVTTASGSAA